MLKQEKYKNIVNKYDLRYKFFWLIMLWVTSILRRNMKEKLEKLLFDWVKSIFIYFKIHVQCIMLDVSSAVELLAHLMLTVKHLTLMNCSSCDSCWFYLFCNICFFLKFLVSRISSCLNVILIIFCWLNSFLLRMFKCCLLMIIVLIYCFYMYLSILLRSVASVCMLKNHVFSLLSFFFVQRFLVFSVLVKSWSKIKLLWRKKRNI